MLSGLFAGLAGVLYAIQNKFAAPDFVFFVVSGEVVIFNVMGGMGTLVGPVAGAAFFLLLREGLSRFFTEYYLIPVGIIFTADGDLHAAGPARLPQAPPEPVAYWPKNPSAGVRRPRPHAQGDSLALGQDPRIGLFASQRRCSCRT